MANRMRIAVATRCFDQPLKNSLMTAANLGAGGVQFDARNEIRGEEFSATGARQLLHMLGELGLSLASLTFPTNHAFYEKDRLDGRVAATRAAMDLAVRLKTKIVTVRIGKIPADDSPERTTLSEVINELAAYGNRVGVTLCITPSREKAEQLSAFLDEITQGPLQINFDPATFVLAGQDPTEALTQIYQLIGHFRVRDAVRDFDGTSQEVAVGRGEVEWEPLLALLGQASYTGWLTVERTSGDEKSRDVARAVQYLNTVGFGAFH